MNKKGKLAAQLQLTMKGNSQCNLLTANHKIQQRHRDTKILIYSDTKIYFWFSLHAVDDDDDHIMLV